MAKRPSVSVVDSGRLAKLPAVSPSLIADISKIPPGWVVPKRFLLGLGHPWEPDPWEYSTAEEDELLIEASQGFEELAESIITTVSLCFIDGFVIIGVKNNSAMVDVSLEGPCVQNEQPKDTSAQGTSVRWGGPGFRCCS